MVSASLDVPYNIGKGLLIILSHYDHYRNLCLQVIAYTQEEHEASSPVLVKTDTLSEYHQYLPWSLPWKLPYSRFILWVKSFANRWNWYINFCE